MSLINSMKKEKKILQTPAWSTVKMPPLTLSQLMGFDSLAGLSETVDSVLLEEPKTMAGWFDKPRG